MKFKINTDMLVILAVIAMAILYYNVVLFNPVVFGDEGWYAGVARYMVGSGDYPAFSPFHQSAVWHWPFSQQPLWFFMNSAAWLMGGEIGVKLLIPICAMLSALMLYLLLKHFNKPEAGLVGALILLTMPSVISYGGIMNYVEASLMLLFLGAIFFAVKSLGTNKILLAITGIFTGFAILTDRGGLLLLPLLLIYWLAVYRKHWRGLLIVLVVAAALVAPWMLRNVAICGAVVIPYLTPDCEAVTDVNIPLLDGIQRDVAAVAATGTGAPVLKLGLMNYADFAFGWLSFMFMLFGIALVKPKKEWLVFGTMVLFVAVVTFYMNFLGMRSEDVPRNTMFGFPAIAAIGGMFISEVAKQLNKKSKWLVVGLSVVILFVLISGAQSRLDSMVNVKHGLDGIVDACAWVRTNTPTDSLIYTIYGHQVAYQCDRRAFAGVPDQAEIKFTANETTYQHLKLHDYNYVLIEYFTISQQDYRETTPIRFVEYLDASPHFEKVFDNSDKYGQGGVMLFKVL